MRGLHSVVFFNNLPPCISIQDVIIPSQSHPQDEVEEEPNAMKDEEVDPSASEADSAAAFQAEVFSTPPGSEDEGSKQAKDPRTRVYETR